MNQHILKKLNEIFQDVFGDDSIRLSEETTVSDIDGWDSLTHISIIAAIQDEFSISFDMDEVMGLDSIRNIVSAIARKLL